MKWLQENQDFVVFILTIIIASAGYWIGNVVGYCQGLEDGFKDGQLNGTR